MRVDKILILALDSVNAQALAPQLGAGNMPHLKRLLDAGVSGTLLSTTPAHTAPAWTTLATGKHPGVHGILNFRRFDPRTQTGRLNANQDVAHKTVWQLLDEAGLRVGVAGQPQSYPPRPLKHGFAISGFETPSTACEFAWPPELKSEVLRQVPEFCFKSERVRDPGAGKDWGNAGDFFAGMDGLCRENENTHALNLYLARTRPWDVLFLYYQITDTLFHKAWRWCDPATREEDPPRARRIDAFFARLDEMLGEILALPQAQGALVMVCSDHGHGPANELVRVNSLLADLGFLKRGGMLAQAQAAWRRVIGQRRGKGLGIAVDWRRTKAYMPFEAIAGFVYLNRLGREPSGCVGEAEIARLTTELAAALHSQRSPHSGNLLFDGIKTPAETYSVRGAFDFPELFVLPARGVNLVRKLSFGAAVEIPAEKHRGTHRPEGFFALSGAGVVGGNKNAVATASIADFAPTILAALGQEVPSDMTGRPLREFFAGGLESRGGAQANLPAQNAGEIYSQAEQAIVEQRLADLGYVD